MPKKILPGRKRQHKARDFVVHHLAETHPALAIKLGRMPRFDPDPMSWGATMILSGRTTFMMAGGEESKAA